MGITPMVVETDKKGIPKELVDLTPCDVNVHGDGGSLDKGTFMTSGKSVNKQCDPWTSKGCLNCARCTYYQGGEVGTASQTVCQIKRNSWGVKAARVKAVSSWSPDQKKLVTDLIRDGEDQAPYLQCCHQK